jgi:ribosomal protein L16/L10AE
MRQSFGVAVGKAARVRRGQVVVSIKLLEAKAAVGKEALRKANAKMPGKKHVEERPLKKAEKKEAAKSAPKESAKKEVEAEIAA